MNLESFNRVLICFELAFPGAQAPAWSDVRTYDESELTGAIAAVKLHTLSRFDADKAKLVLRFVQRRKTAVRPRRKRRMFA